MEDQPDIRELERRLKEAKEGKKRREREERKSNVEDKKEARRLKTGEKKQRKTYKKELRKVRKITSSDKKQNKPKRDGHKTPRSKTKDGEAKDQAMTLPFTLASGCIPIKGIRNGIIETDDGRYVKIIELTPVNFLLRSQNEQKSILYSFMRFLKIAPVSIQMKVIAKKADITEHVRKIRERIENETDEKCRALQEDYTNLIQTVGSKEAVSRRFLLVFQYEGGRNTEYKEVVDTLNSIALTAKKYLKHCENDVVATDNETEHAVELLYGLLCRKESVRKPLSSRMNEVANFHMAENGEGALDGMPVTDYFAPKEIDFRHAGYVVMDGVYHAYLFVPSAKYRSRVYAGWTSLLVNAGEGIDVDLFAYRQDKGKSMERIGRRIRMNRSKIRDTSDTNTDYDDLAESIKAGCYLKNGLAANEDLYYVSILITVTGYSAKEVEWRSRELKKLLVSQDMDAVPCLFRQEHAFLSALPLLNLDKSIRNRSKRNVLTSGLASCYPFVSYEMSDKDGILMGINKANNSLVILDIFDTKKYKNANISILGTSGAGKTFLMQLLALRMRRSGIQVFIVASIKGHEFARACDNIGGEFVKISPASKRCINVMEIRKTDGEAKRLLDGSATERSELAAKIQDLHRFFSLLIPDMSIEERQLLDEALVTTYKGKGITHDNASLTNPADPNQYRGMPILGDVHRELLKRPETKRLANILNRLVNGSASSFNQPTNVDLSNKYVVLDISELSGELLPVGMFIALDYVWSKAKEDRTVRKAIFIDEEWVLTGADSNEAVAEYVVEIYKVIRGYGGAAINATQQLNDHFALHDGKYGKAIINNSNTKIVLNQESDDAEQVRQLLRLSDAEMMQILHFERGSGLISTGGSNFTVDIKASNLERDLITSDRKELTELRERLNLYGNDAYGKNG